MGEPHTKAPIRRWLYFWLLVGKPSVQGSGSTALNGLPLFRRKNTDKIWLICSPGSAGRDPLYRGA